MMEMKKLERLDMVASVVASQKGRKYLSQGKTGEKWGGVSKSCFSEGLEKYEDPGTVRFKV